MKEKQAREIVELLLRRVGEMQTQYETKIDTLASQKFDEVAKNSLITLARVLTKLTKEYTLNNERVQVLTEQIEKFEHANEKLIKIVKLEDTMSDLTISLKKNVDLLEKIVKKLTPPRTQSVI